MLKFIGFVLSICLAASTKKHFYHKGMPLTFLSVLQEISTVEEVPVFMVNLFAVTRSGMIISNLTYLNGIPV